MTEEEEKRICPHCGAENPQQAEVPRCVRCAQLLDDSVPPPTVDLPPAPDLSEWADARPKARKPPGAPPEAGLDGQKPAVAGVDHGSPLPEVGPPPRFIPLVLAGVTLGAPGCAGWFFLGMGSFALAIFWLSVDLPQLFFGVDTGWQIRVPSEGDDEVVWIFSGIFAVALVVVVCLLCRGFRAAYVLAVGEVAEGTLKSTVGTGSWIDKEAIYRVVVEFRDESGHQHEVQANRRAATQPEPGRREPVFYHPGKPKSAVLLDSLAVSLTIDEGGNIRPANALHAKAWIAMAILAIGVPYLLYRLLWAYGPLMWPTHR